MAMSPSTESSKPVAVITTSASITVPSFVMTPLGVNVSISSVTIETCPELMTLKKSPSSIRATRCSDGR